MSFKIHAKNLEEGVTATLLHRENVFCPYCNHLLIPEVLSAFMKTTENKEEWFVYTLLKCPHCKEIFSYHFQYHPEHCWVISFDSLPHAVTKTIFSQRIQLLSPRFVELFNEALVAGDANIEKVAILAFQTSLEYLIKDFLIESLQFEKKPEEIESLTFSQAIEELQTLELSKLSSDSQSIRSEDRVLTKIEEEFTSSWDVRHYIAVIINHIEQLDRH